MELSALINLQQENRLEISKAQPSQQSGTNNGWQRDNAFRPACTTHFEKTLAEALQQYTKPPSL